MRLPFFKRHYKKTDIALVMCPGWGVVQPPVGISYLKSFLKEKGVNVRCFDLSLELYKIFPHKEYWELNYPEHFIVPEVFQRDVLPYLGSFILDSANKILSAGPQMVGFSLFMSSLNMSLLLADRLKKMHPDIFIVGGGAEVTRLKRVVIDGIRDFLPVSRDVFESFDVLIEGEGEENLAEVSRLGKDNKDLYGLKGILFSKNGVIKANENKNLIENLDMLPAPDYDDFSLGSYTRKSLPLVTSRGCINRCTFCADSPLWKIYRYRSAEKVIEEIEFLLKKYNINQFEITDSTFNGNMPRLEKICDLIIERRLSIKWSAKATLRKEMTYELLCKMKDAGCCALAYGVESGSPRVLRDMRKNLNLAEAEEVIKNTSKAGIEANCFFMIGYPTETEEDFQLTLDFIRRNAPYIYRFDQVTGCHIEEDSYLGLNLEKYGIIFREDGWCNAQSNPRIRKDRLDRFRDLARKLHKHYKCETQL